MYKIVARAPPATGGEIRIDQMGQTAQPLEVSTDMERRTAERDPLGGPVFMSPDRLAGAILLGGSPPDFRMGGFVMGPSGQTAVGHFDQIYRPGVE